MQVLGYSQAELNAMPRQEINIEQAYSLMAERNKLMAEYGLNDSYNDINEFLFMHADKYKLVNNVVVTDVQENIAIYEDNKQEILVTLISFNICMTAICVYTSNIGLLAYCVGTQSTIAYILDMFNKNKFKLNTIIYLLLRK